MSSSGRSGFVGGRLDGGRGWRGLRWCFESWEEASDAVAVG